MKRNSFKEYSVNTHNVKRKSSNRRKVVWTIRCEPRVEQNITSEYSILKFHMNTRQIWQISDFGCLHVNIRRILAIELDMCNSNITGFASAGGGLLASVAALLGNFFRCFILVPTILHRIRYILLHFGGPI